MNRQRRVLAQGFTLIELVIVIAIIGLLAIAVLPRFVNLSGEARAARINGALGSARSAAVIVHGAALARNLGSGAATVAAEGANITIINGYPTADAAGILAAAQIDVADFTISGGAAAAGSTVTVQANGATTPANCQFTYQNPAAAGNPPAYTVVTTGC
jgi:MSHA pilin protein MshA